MKICFSHENQIAYIDNILHVDCPPNLEDSDTQVDGMLFHIERSFHKAQSIRMDQDIDSQYMLCYLDNRYHVDILPFVLQIILKVKIRYSMSFNDGLNSQLLISARKFIVKL